MPATATRPHESYLLKKLHSLAGIFPIGAFLAEHFWSNSSALVSAGRYNDTSHDLQTIQFRLVVEVMGIWVPILYHGSYGVYLWLRGKANVLDYPWMKNWLYTLQRYTGLIAFAFIGWHVYTERFLTHGKSTYEGMARTFENPYYLALYVVGILAASFHLGVGIWNFVCKWGIASTAGAQRAAGRLGAIVAVSFGIVGIMIVLCFRLNWHPFGKYL
ncbi:MAG: succinate dehydrogenase [Candidatus Acidiferrales bacterium]|jgi:succinate dehydrogenase / fumarate reductase cytochrome b subunit